MNIFFHEEHEGELFQIKGGCIWKRKNPLFLRFNLSKGTLEKFDCVQVHIEPNFRFMLQSILRLHNPNTSINFWARNGVSHLVISWTTINEVVDSPHKQQHNIYHKPPRGLPLFPHLYALPKCVNYWTQMLGDQFPSLGQWTISRTSPHE